MKTLSLPSRLRSITRRINNKIESVVGDIIRKYSDHEPHILFDIVSERLRQSVLHSKESGVSSETYFPDRQLIVSLTTYGKRLFEVYLAIESIMQQTCKPNRIILWIGEELQNERVPHTLLLQQERGLEIKYCRDIRSYTKLVPALREFPDDVIVTIDDDVIYHYDMLEEMLRTSLRSPDSIVCNRYHKMTLWPDGTLRPYMEWEIECKSDEASVLCFPTGVGGVLYPPKSLADEVLNEDVFMKLCPYADDVWFKAMALLKGTSCQPVCQQIHRTMYIDIPCNRSTLLDYNVIAGGNDKAIGAVFSHYRLIPFKP